jgi:hypothetical protein
MIKNKLPAHSKFTTTVKLKNNTRKVSRTIAIFLFLLTIPTLMIARRIHM